VSGNIQNLGSSIKFIRVQQPSSDQINSGQGRNPCWISAIFIFKWWQGHYTESWL